MIEKQKKKKQNHIHFKRIKIKIETHNQFFLLPSEEAKHTKY